MGTGQAPRRLLESGATSPGGPSWPDRAVQLQQVMHRAEQAHSCCTAIRPRRRNCRKPRACLICPNTGSTIAFRHAYTARPFMVRSFRAIRSRRVRFAGGRPRGAGACHSVCFCRPVAMYGSIAVSASVCRFSSEQYPASANTCRGRCRSDDHLVAEPFRTPRYPLALRGRLEEDAGPWAVAEDVGERRRSGADALLDQFALRGMQIWLSFLCRSMPIWSMAGPLLIAAFHRGSLCGAAYATTSSGGQPFHPI